MLYIAVDSGRQHKERAKVTASKWLKGLSRKLWNFLSSNEVFGLSTGNLIQFRLSVVVKFERVKFQHE